MGKRRKKYYAVTVAIIILVWIVDAAVEYFMAYPQVGFFRFFF